jgi:hypothetical protein
MKLKPVTFVNAKYNKHRQNTTQQIMLLKALRITQDPEKLKTMIGVRTVAEVFRTLDKLALRKEYHRELSRRGVDFGFIINGIKAECLTADKSADRLKGYQILLKSLGMDKYDDAGDKTEGGWEEALRKIVDKKEKETPMLESPKDDDEGGEQIEGDDDEVDEEYEVSFPTMPETVRLKREEDKKHEITLYD